MSELRKKVLIVDDAGPVVILCVNVLQSLGYAVKGANRGEAAVELFAATGDRKFTDRIRAVLPAIEKNFGSFDAWKADYKATAISAKLSGWALLVYDMLYSKRLLNVLVDEHQYGAIWGGIPLISLDVFEHAYYHKDGPKRAAYIDNFLGNLHWGRINDRYKKFAK